MSTEVVVHAPNKQAAVVVVAVVAEAVVVVAAVDVAFGEQIAAVAAVDFEK